MKLQRNAWIGMALGLAVAIAGMASPAAADRPGTPNRLTLRDCGIENDAETICGLFENSASEEVYIETNVSEDNHAVSPGVTMGCQSQPLNNPGAIVTPCSGQPQTHGGDVQFEMRGAKFDATYCFKLRTRRVSDQMVSELWSAPVCLHTGPIPPFPSKPTIQVQFTGSIWANGKQVPQQVQVDVPPLERGTLATVAFGGRSGYEDSRYPSRWVYQVGPNDTAVSVTLCKTNAAGKVCSSGSFDLASQKQVVSDGKTIHVTGAPRGGPTTPPAPRPTSTFNGTWTVSAGSSPFTLQLMLVQGATMGGVISDGNPADKGALRGVLQDATHAQFIVARDTLGRSGTLNVLLSADGNSFNADGVLGGVFVTWRASRTSAPN
jgi:hypothetical protein